MNRKKLFWASLYGGLIAWSSFSHLTPRHEVGYLVLDPEGTASKSFGRNSLRLEIEQQEDSEGLEDFLRVTIEPERNYSAYIFFGLFAVLMTSQFYRQLRWPNDKDRSVVHPDLAEGGRFEEFLKEDEKRRFVPQAYLEEEFNTWKFAKDKKAQQEDQEVG